VGNDKNGRGWRFVCPMGGRASVDVCGGGLKSLSMGCRGVCYYYVLNMVGVYDSIGGMGYGVY
jgi:hypothetical protein